MKVILPWPPKELSPNARVHWRTAAAKKGIYKTACFWLTKQASAGWEQRFCDLPISVTFIQPDMRQRDVDNMLASIKSALDGVALAMEVNDRQFKPLTVDWKRGAKPGAVIVEIGA